LIAVDFYRKRKNKLDFYVQTGYNSKNSVYSAYLPVQFDIDVIIEVSLRRRGTVWDSP
jgi:hypothetical protein